MLAAMRGASTGAPIVVDRSLKVWATGFVFAPIAAVFAFVVLGFLQTTAISVDCTRIDKKQGECTFVRHTLFLKTRTRASIAEIATAKVEEGDDAVGIVVVPRREVLPADSAFQDEKRKLVPRLHAFAQEETPRLQVNLGRWWQVESDSTLLLVAAFVALIVVLRLGKLRVTIDPREKALHVDTTRWGIVPVRETVPLSSVETVHVDPVDEKQDRHRVRVGTATSNVMSKERAQEAATAIAEALAAIVERAP